MKKYAIDLDVSRCIACGACMVACMDQNDFVVQQGRSPYRNVFDMERRKNGTVRYGRLSLACMHCENAPCMISCPSSCIRKDPQTNLTVYDTTNCIGCHSCAMACPYGVPTFGEDGKMNKCDGCYVRIHYGMLPACIRSCPTGALKLVEPGQADYPIAPENSLRLSSMDMLKRQV